MPDFLEMIFSPAGQQIVVGTVQALSGGPKIREHEDRLKRVEERFAAIQAMSVAPTAPLPPPPPPQLPRAPGTDEIRLQLVDISARLKEAGRFAREDGMQHPEVQKRLSDSEAILSRLERYDLAPEHVRGMSPADRSAIEQEITAIRRLRQSVYNRVGTPADLDSVAADVGESAKRLRLAAAGMPAVPHSPTRSMGDYSSYAPEMDIDTGCLPCGKAHLGTVDALLREAAEAAQGEGMASPEVQDRLSVAEEEIMALFADDWTEERIAKSPDHDKAVLEEYAPRVQKIGSRLAAIRSPEELADIAQETAELRERFRASLSPVLHMIGTGHPRGSRVSRKAIETFGLPTGGEIAAVTDPVDVGEMSRRVQEGIASRGVRWIERNIPTPPEGGTIEAYYTREGDQDLITLSPGIASPEVQKTPYGLQVRIHEAAHSLIHNPDCWPDVSETHEREETEVELATVAALVELGVPVETYEGTMIPPGEAEVDWSRLERYDPTAARNVKWATGLLVQAARGESEGIAIAKCPALQDPTITPPSPPRIRTPIRDPRMESTRP